MRSPLPSLDALLRTHDAEVLRARFGHGALADALREELLRLRDARAFGTPEAAILEAAADALAHRFAPSQRPVFNLTGTVLHTNLGRARLPPEAAAAAAEALAEATTLELDLASGKRGERDEHVRDVLRRLSGAEDGTVVNNNAAAVVLILNALAAGREVMVSRGELIEIGGSFRIPEIMARAGARLVEVGTTNRTHARDYRDAIGPDTALAMRVHPSNYALLGFTSAVPMPELARIAHDAGLPAIEDLGSGSLVDLARYGLPHERTPMEALADGADLVSFSGDKLLGGPQAGLIVGRAELVRRLNANPLKRALRLDKARLAALEAVLRLYLAPESLPARLPSLRLLVRTEADIRASAERIRPALAASFPDWSAEILPCRSQIGSGALPVDLLPSSAVAFTGGGLDALAVRLRSLPRPVLGRIGRGRLWLDCRCLEAADEPAFLAQLP